MYFQGENLCLVNHKLWGNTQGFQVLVHEFGHHLAWTDFFGMYGDWANTQHFIQKYRKKVPVDWLKSYSREERQEELTVQCFALWATDWGPDYEVNKGFKDFLKWNGAPPPPF
jgi:hypothetical protein